MHDRLCSVSAIAPGAFLYLLQTRTPEAIDALVQTISKEIIQMDVHCTSEQVSSRVSQALTQLAEEMARLPVVDGQEMVPDSDWFPYFDYAYAICFDDDDGESVSGHQVELRTVYNSGEHNDFWDVVTDIDNGTMETLTTDCSNPYFFVLMGPYHYLQTWIDFETLPSRTEQMSFHGELFEIVNEEEGRLHPDTGLLDCISYGGIEKTCSDSTSWLQTEFVKAMDPGLKHTKLAIQQNISDDALKRGIARDFNCWQTKRPNSWPTYDPAIIPPFTQLSSERMASTIFDRLPTELLITIFSFIPIDASLSFSTACRSTRTTFRRIIDPVIASMYQTGGPLHWILPITAIKGEPERAEKAYRTWLPVTVADRPKLPHGATSAIQVESFPHFDFLRACYGEEEDSMRNRRRLWDIVKQFEELWYDYRSRCKPRS